MKVHLLGGVAVAALIVAGPALSADLPLKAPPKLAPWTWSGFYLGGHAGYGWSHDPQSVAANDPFFFGKFPSFGVAGYDGKGWLAGFHAGANWQDGRIVGGLEIDLSATGIQGSSNAAVGPNPDFVGMVPTLVDGTARTSGRFEWLGSARARLGYLATPDILLYGTGGLAWTHYTHNEDQLTNRNAFALVPPQADGVFSSTSYANWRFGWVAGIGGEMRLFNSNWLGRLEYLHYDFGRSENSAVSMYYAGPWPRSGGNLTADVVRVGLSYKFDPDRFALGYTGADAFAALPYAKSPVAATPWTWAGFYLGAHGGYGWADDPFNKTLGLTGFLAGAIFPPLSGVDSRGFVAGFHAGANWQSRSVVGGLELDISGTGIKGSSSSTAGGLRVTQNDKFDPLGSVRARLGYLVTPDVMVYGTGGLAWTQFSATNEFPGFTPSSLTTQNWLFGWAGGVGAEARLGNTNWLARVEYLHYDFGNSGSVTGDTGILNGAPVRALSSGRLSADVVRAGLSYKLNWPDPAGAGRTIIAKAVVPAVWSWSGFSVGGHGGYGWGDDRSRVTVEPSVLTLDSDPLLVGGVRSSGYVAGFQAGGNWQSGPYVGGLEIDLSKTGIKGAASVVGLDNTIVPAPLSGVLTDKFDMLGSVRARLGYLVRPDLLLYGTGGLAWTRLEQTLVNANTTGTLTTVAPTWRSGWVAGAGGQLRLGNSNWLARLEYLHYDFGNSGGTRQGFIDPNEADGIGIVKLDRAGRLTTDAVRAGIDYKFD